MSNSDELLMTLALKKADIMVPKKGTDLTKWAVVACDQYTSEPEYWERTSAYVGEDPSTLRLIFPECYLEEPNPQERINQINTHMSQYINEKLFDTYKDSFFLVHRSTGGASKGRWGLLVSLDLEQYSYAKDSRTLIRATEGTILSRIPPRKEIRKNAPLELPHIMVLLSDDQRSVIEPLANKRNSLKMVYDTDLMEGGGHLSAWVIDKEEDFSIIAESLQTMHDRLDPENPLLYAMGDGNHSLATAKSCWEDVKKNLNEEEKENHPARFALVELENIYDPGLEFEPIHRVLFGLDIKTFTSEIEKCAKSYSIEVVEDLKTLHSLVNKKNQNQQFGFCNESGFYLFSLVQPISSIAAGTLQVVIDSLLNQKKATVDYIHGEQVVSKLGRQKGNCGLILPDVAKETFFESIIKDNALPRKTFSMGEAHEKRFYMEARKIQK
ncbi:DUF1015 domain-containing protein [uncultured Sphaerochaeta sp.]|uniref:DUF1015 domain-containing protein n=1 Tax=uncultured Sphaerochaeta sp. TaxID=886478 RepID=UPI002A0A4589|nr:DUF1015 domain-containing protein [uncultured Sphaerochaeta sp.]